MASIANEDNSDPGRPASAAESIYADFVRRRAAGESADLEALCARHPEHAMALRVLASAEEDEAGEPAIPEIEKLLRTRLIAGAPAVPARERGEPRYTVRREVARGGMGVIYEVWDNDLERPLAMKVLQETANVQRFLNEARITARLDHPGVVPVHEIGADAVGRSYFIMPLVEGIDLEEVFRRNRAGEDGWTLTRALDVLLRVCDTLAYAHSRGVIHRDLKPENIMVGRFGETYIVDWGLAKAREDEAAAGPRQPAAAGAPGAAEPASGAAPAANRSPALTLAGTVLGTPAYMAPEQAAGRIEAVDERSDIYSLGAMLYTLLAGQRPYIGGGKTPSSDEIIQAVLHGPPSPVQSLVRDAPPELVAICEKAMQRAPESRYASMSNLGEDLRSFLDNRVVSAYQTGLTARFRKWVARNRALAAALLASALIALGALSAFIAWQELTRREIAVERDEKGKALEEKGKALDERSAALQEKILALTEKERALRHAEARRLIAHSAAELGKDPTLSLLLALEGAEREPGPIADNALLEALAGLREHRVLEGHEDWVYSAVFSPDSRRVVTAGADATVRIWDVETGGEIDRLIAPERLKWIIFDAAADRLLATSLFGSHVHVWDTRTGALESSVPFPSRTGAIARSPRGDRFYVGTYDGRVSTVDASRLEILGSFQASASYIFSIDCHPTGDQILVAGRELVATRWDPVNGAKVGPDFADGTIARFHPDGSRIAACLVGAGAALFDGGTGSRIRTLEGHQENLRQAAFSPDGSLIATASQDGTARLWKADTGQPVGVLQAHRSDVNDVTFSPDGRWLATASSDRTARIWRLSSPLAVRAPIEIAAAPAPLLRRDGRRALFPRGRAVEIWDPIAGSKLMDLAPHPAAVSCAAWSADGRMAATGSYADVRLHDAETGETVRIIDDPGATILNVCFDRPGTRLLTTTQLGLATVFDTATGEQIASLPLHRNHVRAGAISDDGRLVVTGSLDGFIRISDSRTGQMEWETAPGSTAYCARVLDRGASVIAGFQDNSALLLEAPSGRIVRRFRGHRGHVLQVEVHAGKGLVATRSTDQTARLWDFASGEERLSIQGPPGGFRQVLFSADGETLYTLAGECDLRAWPVRPLAPARRLAPRELVPEELERYEIGDAASRTARRLARRSESLRRDAEIAARIVRLRPESELVRAHHQERVKRQLAEIGRAASLLISPGSSKSSEEPPAPNPDEDR